VQAAWILDASRRVASRCVVLQSQVEESTLTSLTSAAGQAASPGAATCAVTVTGLRSLAPSTGRSVDQPG